MCGPEEGGQRHLRTEFPGSFLTEINFPSLCYVCTLLIPAALIICPSQFGDTLRTLSCQSHPRIVTPFEAFCPRIMSETVYADELISPVRVPNSSSLEVEDEDLEISETSTESTIEGVLVVSQFEDPWLMSGLDTESCDADDLLTEKTRMTTFPHFVTSWKGGGNESLKSSTSPRRTTW